MPLKAHAGWAAIARAAGRKGENPTPPAIRLWKWPGIADGVVDFRDHRSLDRKHGGPSPAVTTADRAGSTRCVEPRLLNRPKRTLMAASLLQQNGK